MGAAVIIAAAGLAYSVYANEDAQRRYDNAKNAAQEQADAEVAERNRVTAEHTAAITAEAERERALAISNQDAQNVRVNALATEAAANEKAIAQNISEKTQEEALITKQAAARENARIQDLQAQTQGRQLAALASGGVAVGDEGGTAGALLLDTKTRANKDITANTEAATSRVNLLQKTGAFAVEQGDVSSKNILDTASHNTETMAENVKNAADTLVANAKIGGATEQAMANLQNLMTLGSAAAFSNQVDRLKSESNAKMWSNLLGSNIWSPTNINTIFGSTATAETL
jgi:hypothetical protein